MMRCAVIDADFIPYIFCHVKKEELELYSAGKPFWKICSDIDEYIKSLLIEVNASHYIGAVTTSKCFRYKIYPEYKANRSKLQQMPFIKLAKAYMQEQWKFISHPDLEADDIVNIAKNHYGDDISFIVSPDKDLLSLEGENYNPNKKEWTNISEEKANESLWKSLIVGDNADFIKGLIGKGEAFFNKRFEDKVPTGGAICDEYIAQLGETKGIEEFYKNYKCLKIVDSYEGFEVPKPIEFLTELPM